MTVEVHCGIEEPVCPNEQILAVDAQDNVCIADFEIARLNRYSFVWKDGSSIELSVADDIINYKNTPRTVVLGWEHFGKSANPIRSIATRKRLDAEGWSTYDSQGMVLGFKSFDRLDELRVPSGPFAPMGWFVMLGKMLSGVQLFRHPFVATIRNFCSTSRLEPSRVFLENIASEEIVVGYPAQGPSDLHGLILLSTDALGQHLVRLRKRNIVSVVYSGAAASQVWVRS